MDKKKKDTMLLFLMRITEKNSDFDFDSNIWVNGLLTVFELVYLLTELYINDYLNRSDIINITNNEDLTLSYITNLIHDN